jgi:iron complex transport system permease protein
VTEQAFATTRASRLSAGQQFLLRLAIALVLLVGCVLLSLSQGAADIPVETTAQILLAELRLPVEQDWSAAEETIVVDVRLPRVLMAAVVGGVLATCGGAYQGVFRNPLADPYLIGAASGAALGGTIAIVSSIDGNYYAASLLTAFAFVGALTASFLSFALGRSSREAPTVGLILAGVAVSAFATAVTSLLMLRSEEDLRVVLSWVLGGFNLASWDKMWLLLPYAVPAVTVVLLHGRLLNAMQVDDEEAQHLGVDVARVRFVLIATVSVATAAAVSVSGIIGFVGLIVPHAIRLLGNVDYRQLLPLSALVGAALLVLADLLARTIIEPAEVPVGVLTAMLGAPFFLLLLQRRQAVRL